jgi:hypothetical protein
VSECLNLSIDLEGKPEHDHSEAFSIAVQEDNLLKAWATIVNELDAETNTVSQDVLDAGTGLARLCRNVLVGNSVNKWVVR